MRRIGVFQGRKNARHFQPLRGHITLWRVPEGTSWPVILRKQACRLDPASDFAATSDLTSGTLMGHQVQRKVHVVDLRDGKELWTAVASREFVTALAFSPDGKTLASAAGFGESDIRLWEVATGSEIGRLEGHHSWVGSLVFWPDGKKLASCSADQTIRVWDLSQLASVWT